MLDVDAYLEKHRLRRQSNKVLHGHPSPSFWSERSVPAEAILAERAAGAIRRRVNLYVGTPYCLPTNPDRCGFCLFPSEVYKNRRQLDEYLAYLIREGEILGRYFANDRLASIYFGGGTSNLYTSDQYGRLMGIVRQFFDVPSTIEVTLEGIPQLFTRDKLLAMKQSGITRVSIGVQQLDDDMIKASGRKQKAEQVFNTLRWCAELGLPASVDLIFGWPRQTVDRMMKDLEAVVAAGVPHITHYELNVAGRTAFARHLRDELPSPEQNLDMYRVGCAFLESRGYRQATAYDWEKVDCALPTSYEYEEIFRKPFQTTAGELASCDAWGWGFAGVSFFLGTPQMPGWAYMNHPRIDQYFKSLDAAELPIACGFHYTPTDLLLYLIFQELQGMSVDVGLYRHLFGIDVLEKFHQVWTALERRQWIQTTPDRVVLTRDGAFYTPLIQSVLAHERMEEMRRHRSTPNSSDAFVALADLRRTDRSDAASGQASTRG